MAGKYTHLTVNKVNGVLEVEGQTHGCSCCASTNTVSLPEIEEHIESLSAAMKEARSIRRRMLRIAKRIEQKLAAQAGQQGSK